MAADCLFCRIIEGTIPSTTVREDADTVAFRDINPQAPTHILVVPRRHFANVAELSADPDASTGLLRGIRGLVEQEGITDYRTIFNTGAGVGQTVFHVHAHVLAGRQMGWPPG